MRENLFMLAYKEKHPTRAKLIKWSARFLVLILSPFIICWMAYVYYWELR